MGFGFTRRSDGPHPWALSQLATTSYTDVMKQGTTDEYEALSQAVGHALRTKPLRVDTALGLIANALELAEQQPFRRESIAGLMMVAVEQVKSSDERLDEMWDLFAD